MSAQAFVLLQKEQREELLPELYAAARACERTHVFVDAAPCQTYVLWQERMTAALDDPQRYLLLLYGQDKLAGYVQYSLQEDVVLLEYAVVAPEWQSTPLFRMGCQYLLQQLPPHIRYLDDWVSRQRPAAIDVNRRIGMETVGETENGAYVRMRAQIPDVKKLF